MNAKLKQKLKELPRSPGVYFHKAKSGEIIYVGKAAVLKNRVRQYFQSVNDMDIKTRALVDEIYDTDWVETESEIDALFLESEMVKRYMPRYNILLRDDKSQTYVRIDSKSKWPTVSFTRNPMDDKADYFGPYYNGLIIKKALRHLRRVFPYYTKPPKEGERPSLDAFIGLNPKPGTTSKEYRHNIKQLTRYLNGERHTIFSTVEKEMHQAASRHDFEAAALLRNKLNALRSLNQKIMFGDKEFMDLSKDKALSDLVELFTLTKIPERIEGYDVSHMGGRDVVASMVVFTNGVSDRSKYRKFKMQRQQNNDYESIHEVIHRRFSEKNIKDWGLPDIILIDGGKGQLGAAAKALSERGIKIPVISVAKKNEEIVVHQDKSNIDTSKLAEYYADSTSTDGLKIEQSDGYYLINLHWGQVNASGHSKNLRSADGQKIAKYTHLIKLIQRLRDESHRFAVSYHTVLKRSRQTKSVLEDVPGIGPATRRKLIKEFGSIKLVASADEDKLTMVVGQKIAKEIKALLS